jgi:hypothetical protein
LTAHDGLESLQHEKVPMPVYPLGISRSQDVAQVGEKALLGPPHVRWSRVGELACALIETAHGGLEPLQHAAMLSAIHRHMGVLPMRFGTTVRDEVEIHALLQSRRGELLERLAWLDGACEMAVRITCPSPCGMATGAATETALPLGYLAQRRSHYQRADAAIERERRLVQQFVEGLEDLYRDWRILPAASADLIRLAFLVPRDRVAAFRRGVADSGHVREGGRCAVLGPWPPYSFVGVGAQQVDADIGRAQPIELVQGAQE